MIKRLYEEYQENLKYFGSFWGVVYNSIWFTPIYNIINFPSRAKRYVTKFIYYGRVGTKCYDFDTSSVYTLIDAHIKRVETFMKSNGTHLVWNEKATSKGMKRLREFSELCTMMDIDEMRSSYYLSKEIDKHGGLFGNLVDSGKGYSTYHQTDEAKNAKRIAIKKDDLITKQRLERYHYMFQKYLPSWWD